MEVCVSRNTSADRLVRKHSGSLSDPHNTTHSNLRNPPVDHLKTCLQHVNFENAEPKKDDIVNLKRDNGAKDVDKIESTAQACHKCLSKCASYPPIGVIKSSADGLSGGKKMPKDVRTATVPDLNHHAESLDHSTSLHSPVKLVSSMKGSREKQGISREKLTVTWAPDVYDPIPTSVSHVPNNNQHYRHNGKKYGKSKRRGGGKPAGGKNKDKKQPKKNGSTSKCKPLHDHGGTSGLNEPEASIVDFEVASVNPSCGTSFLKTSVTKLHFSVAEAT